MYKNFNDRKSNSDVDIASILTVTMQVSLRYLDKLKSSHIYDGRLKYAAEQFESQLERFLNKTWTVESDNKILAMYNRIMRDRTYVSNNERKALLHKLKNKYGNLDEIGVGIEMLCDLFEADYDIADKLYEAKETTAAFKEEYLQLLAKYDL